MDLDMIGEGMKRNGRVSYDFVAFYHHGMNGSTFNHSLIDVRVNHSLFSIRNFVSIRF